MRRLRFSVGSLIQAAFQPSHALAKDASASPVSRCCHRWESVNRRSVLMLRVSLVALLGLASPVLAQPVNDSFASPTVINGSSGSVSGSNVGATLEPNEPSLAGNPGGQSVWYVWTAPSD